MQSEAKMEVVYMVAENFGVTITERVMFLWLSLLDEYPDAVVQKAALNLIRNTGNEQVAYKTMPPFSVMQRELDAISGKVSDQKELTALRTEKAWDNLLKAIEAYGSYRMPDGLDDTTRYCIRSLGGWSAVCNWRESDLNWRRKEFADLFATVDGRTDGETLSITGKREPTAIGDIIKGVLGTEIMQ